MDNVTDANQTTALARARSWLARVWIRFLILIGRRWLAPYVDGVGQGWRKPPEWLTSEWPDEGQWDGYKRDMRVFLYRADRQIVIGSDEPNHARNLTASELRELGLGRAAAWAPRVWPMGEQLAGVCRELGFARFARASAGDFIEDSRLEAVYARHSEEVEREIVARRDALQEARRRGNIVLPTPEEEEAAAVSLRAVLDLGPFDESTASSHTIRPFAEMGTGKIGMPTVRVTRVKPRGR